MAIAPPPIDAHDALDVESGKQNEFIEVVGMYSPGFNMSPDPLSFCIEYAPSKRLWRDCGHGLYVVDLGKEKPEKPKQ